VKKPTTKGAVRGTEERRQERDVFMYRMGGGPRFWRGGQVVGPKKGTVGQLSEKSRTLRR